MTQRRNCQTFTAEVNGREYTFNAYTTSTRNGFCHTIKAYYWSECGYYDFTDTKVSYYNRTWERFEYESALSRAIEKCPKADQKDLRDILIERKAQAKHEECAKFMAAFESAYKGLNKQSKETLANCVGNIETEAQAHAALGLAQVLNILQ